MHWRLGGLKPYWQERLRLRQKVANLWWCWIVFGFLLVFLSMQAALAQEAECAEVKIVIEQKLSLERQAFDVRMAIRNGLDSSSLERVKVELTFKDQDQNDVVVTSNPNASGADFFIRIDQLTGLSALDGSANIAPKATADVKWLMIPSQGAGGTTTQGRLYYIGAKITYTLDGQTSTVEVTPDYVVVRPQPLLELDYFLPRDVYADDPFTDVVEQAEPFTLGVRVANVGAGAAVKTKIESAQPKIVENRQGLLIDFKILGGYVNNESAGQSLLLNFGDIEAKTAKMGRWMMQTTLAGRFTEFNASFIHADTLGGAVTSLVKEVRVHRLVHDVLVDLPGNDLVDDFLAEEGNGFRVYDSQGGDAPAFDLSKVAVAGSTAGGDQSIEIPATQGLVYIKLADTYRGNKAPVQVLRSDGKALPLQNFWLSKTKNSDLSWSYHFHIFDANTPGHYTVVYSSQATASLDGFAYRDSNGNGVRDAGEVPEGNLLMTLKGVDTLGRNISVDAYTNQQGAYSYRGINPGRYQLELMTRDGLVNGVAVAGSAGGTATSGLVTDIVLAAGTEATGYIFSKRRPSYSPANPEDTIRADALVTIQTSANQVRPDQLTTITITAKNAGPSAAQAVSVQAQIPAGFRLQTASASLGTYAQGSWSVGALTKDQTATLTLNVLADTPPNGASRSIVWPVSIGASTVDPQTANNQANVTLLVQGTQSDLVLTQSLPAHAEVLVWAACPHLVADEQAACAQGKTQAAQTWLNTRAARVQATTTLAQWQQAMRSGQFNVFWVSGGVAGLHDTAIAEIKAAVRRGGSLIVEGASGDQLARLSDVLGALPAHAASGRDANVSLQGSSAAQVTAGNAYGLNLQTAQSLAYFSDSGNAAISAHAFGHGQAMLAGFDVLDTVRVQSFWSVYAQQQLQAMTPLTRTEPVLAGVTVPVRLNVGNTLLAGVVGAQSQSATVEMALPLGVQLRSATPAPQVTTQTGGGSITALTWPLTVDPGQASMVDVNLTMPSVSGKIQVESQLLKASDQVRLSARSLALDVLGMDVLPARVGQSLSALTGIPTQALGIVNQAQAAWGAAQAAQSNNQWGEVLDALAALQSQLELLAAAPYAMPIGSLQLDVAYWIALAQVRWVPVAIEPPAQVMVVSGSQQTATVAQAFSGVLKASVVDVHGKPVAGVDVRFVMPASGASAVFGGAVRTATVATNALGVAASPTFTANSVAGAYQASAMVDGVQAAATFALENLAIPAPVLRLQVLEGQSQLAQIGTLYAKPLRVQVLNAQNQPQSGVTVRFELPSTSGATAVFEPQPSMGLTAVEVVTTLDGIASTPLLHANSTVGSYRALAGVVGVPSAGTVEFALSNIAGAVPTPRFNGSTVTGSGAVVATVSGGGPDCAFNLNATRMTSAQGVGAVLGRFLLPHGMFDFELVSCTPGAEVTISTTWPDLRGITGYLKYGVTSTSGGRKIWYAPHNVRINGNTVTYTIRDGGLGDDDLIVNGTIVDPGGPVIQSASIGAANAIPTLGDYALVMLSLLMLGCAGWQLRAPKLTGTQKVGV